MIAGTCIDCGLDVTYDDDGHWPWKGIDGSETCNARKDRIYNCHRIPRDDAEDVFKAFKAVKGRKARHS